MNHSTEEPVEQIDIGNCKITLLGTAHVSKASVNAVTSLIESDQFDAVAIELCPGRYNALIDPDSLAKMDLFNVIKSGKAASLALGAFQQKMADELGIEPGAEMKMAASLAKQKHLPVLLIDRDVGTTLKRVYRNVPWWKRMELFSGLLASVIFSEKIDEKEIEWSEEGFNNAITKRPKATVNITIPVKIVYSPKCSDFSPKIPATLPPRPVAAKYNPIIKEAYFTGANFVTNDNDTGEEHNSPIV